MVILLAKVADTPTRRWKRLAIVADYDFSFLLLVFPFLLPLSLALARRCSTGQAIARFARH
jgi:hypothetical protein